MPPYSERPGSAGLAVPVPIAEATLLPYGDENPLAMVTAELPGGWRGWWLIRTAHHRCASHKSCLIPAGRISGHAGDSTSGLTSRAPCRGLPLAAVQSEIDLGTRRGSNEALRTATQDSDYATVCMHRRG